jgi:uncharacterized protein YjdB
VNDVTPPANVSSLTGTAGNTQVTLTWIDPADADLDQIEITWTPGGTTPVNVAKGAQTYTITGLTNGTAYTFTVKAVDTAANKNSGATATVTPNIVSGSQGITVSFTDAGAGAFSETSLTVKQDGTPSSQTITLTGSWSTGEWRVDGLVKGNGPNFVVNAADYTIGGHTLQVKVSDETHSWSKTLPFTVTAGVTEISLNKSALTLPPGGTETLFATVFPVNAANKTVTWTSSNESIATVNATTGLVTAKATGTATITATSADNSSANTACTVTVAAAQGITVNFTDAGAGAFSETSLTVKQDGTSEEQSKTIALTGSWSTGEWRVDGLVKGNGPNFVVIAADYTIGGHTLQVRVSDETHSWSKTLPFTVIAGVTGISLNKSALSLLVNGTETLYAAITPANAADKTVTWTSSDASIATVNATTGLVTAKAIGSATITAASVDNPSKSTACTVTVGAAQGITVSFTDAGAGAFSETSLTVKKSGTGEEQSKTITLTGSWSTGEWRVDGLVRENSPSFTVNAADYTAGGHTLQVTVYNETHNWSKTLPFTVED